MDVVRLEVRLGEGRDEVIQIFRRRLESFDLFVVGRGVGVVGKERIRLDRWPPRRRLERCGSAEGDRLRGEWHGRFRSWVESATRNAADNLRLGWGGQDDGGGVDADFLLPHGREPIV